MPIRTYGLGSLFAIPTATYPKPIPFAILKGVTLDMGGELDTLRGEKIYAIDAAKKNGKVGGKIDLCEYNPDALALVIPGASSATGITTGVRDYSASIPTTPFQITVPNSATWSKDLGVRNATTGALMTRAATATGTGVYSVAAGVYTFNTADSGVAVLISYEYTTAGTGATITITNQVMTTSTPFGMDLFNTTSSKIFTVRLNAVHIPKMSFGLKSEGWAEASLEYEAVADSSGVVGYVSMSD